MTLSSLVILLHIMLQHHKEIFSTMPCFMFNPTVQHFGKVLIIAADQPNAYYSDLILHMWIIASLVHIFYKSMSIKKGYLCTQVKQISQNSLLFYLKLVTFCLAIYTHANILQTAFCTIFIAKFHSWGTGQHKARVEIKSKPYDYKVNFLNKQQNAVPGNYTEAYWSVYTYTHTHTWYEQK